MLKELKKESNRVETENGALTEASTFSECLDLFATAGALRHADKSEVVARMLRAYAENAEQALKILFFARDVRGGLGERRFFRVALHSLANSAPQSCNKKYTLHTRIRALRRFARAYRYGMRDGGSRVYKDDLG